MCEYVDKNICNLTKENCPYLYFCNKTLSWKESKDMPANCKIKEKTIDIPKGHYAVAFARKGLLYVNIKGIIYPLDNPYKDEEVPKYVKIQKNKQGDWIVKNKFKAVAL